MNMPKSSKKQINEDEKKLLKILQTNSGDNIDKIAKKCGFSRQKLWRIKKRFEKDKTIWGYNAVVDPEKLDLKHYTALVKRSVKPFDEKMMDKITTERLDDLLPGENVTVEDCLYVHGNYDWILTFTAPDTKQMKKFCEKLMGAFSGYITKIDIQETMVPIRKQGFKHPMAKKLKDFL